MDDILALPAPFLRITVCCLPIVQDPSGKQRTRPLGIVGLFMLDTHFGENDFLLEGHLLLMICGSIKKLNLEDHPVPKVILGANGQLSKTTDLKGP